MRIAVTGGRGFIGQATIAAAGHKAWAFDRADGNDVLGDLSALDSAEVVIHLAGMLGTAELFDQPEEAVDANVTGTLRILEWCRRNQARYVGITMPDSNWANVYQATKLCATRLASAWYRNYGVPVAHVRAFNAYGPGQKHGPNHPRKIIPTFATQAWSGQPIEIWGSGLQTVDLVHVNDVARMLLAAADIGNDQTFDAGTGIPVTVRQVAEFVHRMTGTPVGHTVCLPMRAGETPDSNIVAKGEGWAALKWRPELNWSALADTVRSYQPR